MVSILRRWGSASQPAEPRGSGSDELRQGCGASGWALPGSSVQSLTHAADGSAAETSEAALSRRRPRPSRHEACPRLPRAGPDSEDVHFSLKVFFRCSVFRVTVLTL